jgi:hypothetical protein
MWAERVAGSPLPDFAHRRGAHEKVTGADFQMLTGTQSEIERLWKSFGVY